MTKPLPNSYSVLIAGEALTEVLAGFHDIDTIVPLTYTTTMDILGDSALSVLSRMSIDAAVELAQVHDSAQIVIASEHTFGPDQPSTGELMRDFAVGRGIKPRRVELVGNGREAYDNTPLQIVALKRELATHSLGSNVLAVAFDYHIPRILRHARSRHLPLNAVGITEVLAASGRSACYPEFDYAKTGMHGFKRWENMVSAVSRFNPAGHVLNVLTSLRGPQVHDLTVDPSTGLVTETNLSTKNFIEKLSNQSATRSQ